MDNRSIFALNGLTGFAIAVVLTLSIYAILVYFAIGAQQAAAEDYYYIEDAKSVKMVNESGASAKHMKTWEAK